MALYALKISHRQAYSAYAEVLCAMGLKDKIEDYDEIHSYTFVTDCETFANSFFVSDYTFRKKYQYVEGPHDSKFMEIEPR